MEPSSTSDVTSHTDSNVLHTTLPRLASISPPPSSQQPPQPSQQQESTPLIQEDKYNHRLANNIQQLNDALHSNDNLHNSTQPIVVNPVPIPGYEYVKNIGHGSFGVVNLCRAGETNNPNNPPRLYVMKLVNLQDSPKNVCEGARAEV